MFRFFLFGMSKSVDPRINLMPGLVYLVYILYALPKQNKLNRKRHRHCHGMHGQYNLPDSRIFRFSIPANAGASGGLRPPEPPTRGAAP